MPTAGKKNFSLEDLGLTKFKQLQTWSYKGKCLPTLTRGVTTWAACNYLTVPTAAGEGKKS